MSIFSKEALLPTLARVGRRLPMPLVSAHMVAALEFARHMQWLSPPAQINGRSFAITIEDLGLRCCFSCEQGRFRPHWPERLPIPPSFKASPQKMDLELGATLADFASLARGSVDADTLFFQRRLRIAGDTDLGLIVKNWLDATERPAWLSNM